MRRGTLSNGQLQRLPMQRRWQSDTNLPLSPLASYLYTCTFAVTWGAKLRFGILGLLHADWNGAQPTTHFPFLSISSSVLLRRPLCMCQSEGPRSVPPPWLSLGLQGEYLLRHPALGRPALGKKLTQPWKEIPGSRGARCGRPSVCCVCTSPWPR